MENLIKTGDIILEHTKFRPFKVPVSIVSLFIRILTGCKWNHAGLAVRENGKVYVIDALGKGVTKREWSEFRQPMNKDVSLWRVKSKYQYRTMAETKEEANSLVGIPYDIANLFIHQPILLLFKVWIGRIEQAQDKLACSELVAYLYRGIFPKWYRLNPVDLIKSGKLDQIA
jgi:hypothetical protein